MKCKTSTLGNEPHRMLKVTYHFGSCNLQDEYVWVDQPTNQKAKCVVLQDRKTLYLAGLNHSCVQNA